MVKVSIADAVSRYFFTRKVPGIRVSGCFPYAKNGLPCSAKLTGNRPILTPALRRSSTTCCCTPLSDEGRPKRFPEALALAIPECVRSISRSFSNSATAEITCMVILPAALVRSTPPSARQCTRIPDAASCSTVFLTSIAFRPRRSSLVTISTSPFSILSSRRVNPGRSLAATEPLMCSSISLWDLTVKPAASISLRWFSVFYSSVETRQ